MAEYIGRRAASATLYEVYEYAVRHELAMGVLVPATDVKAILLRFEKALNSVPPSDVAEVKHGQWIYHECVSSCDGAISGYSCSMCSAFVNEEIFDLDEFHKDFCGHCGAKMDGGNEDGK